MDVKELRVGNRINYKGQDVEWSLEDFAEVKYHILVFVKPIPLTEEWLLKLGFKYDDNTWCSVGMNITQDENGFKIWLGGDLGLKHVHQLQNLYFALTGEELTIKE